MRVKKEGILYSFILSFIISIMSFTVAFASVKAADGMPIVGQKTAQMHGTALMTREKM